MDSNSANTFLGQRQRIALAVFSLILAILLFFSRAGINSSQPLDELARKSFSPEIALNNGKPSIFEFYADWCTACREMAPSMLSIYKEFSNKVDFIFLNVDNQLWQDLIDEYEVNGIPYLVFFDPNGNYSGRSIGLRTEEELREITTSLVNNEDFSPSFIDGSISIINSSSLLDTEIS